VRKGDSGNGTQNTSVRVSFAGAGESIGLEPDVGESADRA
jgi:hypothetical protein